MTDKHWGAGGVFGVTFRLNALPTIIGNSLIRISLGINCGNFPKDLEITEKGGAKSNDRQVNLNE